MTLKDLLLKYEFDTLIPDLILTEKPAKDNLYAFKEAFDELRRMEPGDPHDEQIIVDKEVDTDDEGNEIDRYLHASHCEGDLWAASIAIMPALNAKSARLKMTCVVPFRLTNGKPMRRERPNRFHIGNTPWNGHDIHLILICSQ